jgi:hypothetical protein
VKSDAHRRADQRRYEQRKRDRAWLAAARGRRTCPFKQGLYGVCRGVLEEITIDGRLVIHCPRCERRRRGLCQDCPRPVTGRVGSARRCASCRTRFRQRSIRAYQECNREKRNARNRDRYFANAEARERKLAYKRAWRKAHPDKVRAQKRRAALRQRAKHLEYHRKYNARRRAAKAKEMRERYRAEHPIPQPRCVCCHREIPWALPGAERIGHRPPKRCVFCEARVNISSLRAAIKRWARRAETEPLPIPPMKVRPWTPKQPTRRNAAGERLCLTPACSAVVRGREKRCEPCKAHDLVAAYVALAPRRGRGHRTDLERQVA